MTDKQIIIDGVDVYNCAYITYRDSENPICSETGQCCRGYDICYYKQLQQAKQENKKLKTQYNCYACGNCKGKEDYINLEKHHMGLRKQFDKQHKILEEIRTIVDVIACKEPENCGMNKPDWNGEVYGCELEWKKPQDLCDCPSKLATAILNKIQDVQNI